jgi:hypothetical protein
MLPGGTNLASVTYARQEGRMRKTRGWTGPRTAVVALTLGLLAAPAVQAGPIVGTQVSEAEATAALQSGAATSVMEYTTAGTIGQTGITGPNGISFNAVAGGSLLAPSAFSLGEFLVSALPAGVSTSYENTPFEINYIAQKVNGETPGENGTPTKITGVLNGTITGPNQSSVVAKFDPIEESEFRTGDFLNKISVNGMVLLVPSSNNGGRTTAQATLTATYSPVPPVPEPATITVFLAAIAGLGLRRRMRAKLA